MLWRTKDADAEAAVVYGQRPTGWDPSHYRPDLTREQIEQQSHDAVTLHAAVMLRIEAIFRCPVRVG